MRARLYHASSNVEGRGWRVSDTKRLRNAGLETGQRLMSCSGAVGAPRNERLGWPPTASLRLREKEGGGA
jgi:hypothetical protein